jgi:hypothetical protein
VFFLEFAKDFLKMVKDLFTLREDTDCDTHDLISCQCTQKGVSPIPPELDDYDFDLDDDRDCQLGTPCNKKKESHKTVDQLMDWQHFGQPFSSGIFEVIQYFICILCFIFAQVLLYQNVLQDVCLESALENVTFVLRCVSGTTNN